MTVPGAPLPQRAMTELWMRALVTQASPLRVILLDRDTTELDATPDTLVADLAVDDQVWVAMLNGSLTVVGRDGGTPATVAATAGMVVVRDASGRTQFADPSADADVDTKGARDTAIATERALPAQGVIPSSVEVGSGSASVADDGTITLTNVSDFSLNDIFGVGDYEIIANITNATSCVIQTRLRYDGTDVAGTHYHRTGDYTSLSAGPTRSAASGQDSFALICTTTAGTLRYCYARQTFFSPGEQTLTGMQNHLMLVANSDRFMWNEFGTCSTTAGDGSGACTGISVIASAGVMNGTYKVVKL